MRTDEKDLEMRFKNRFPQTANDNDRASLDLPRFTKHQLMSNCALHGYATLTDGPMSVMLLTDNVEELLFGEDARLVHENLHRDIVHHLMLRLSIWALPRISTTQPKLAVGRISIALCTNLTDLDAEAAALHTAMSAAVAVTQDHTGLCDRLQLHSAALSYVDHMAAVGELTARRVGLHATCIPLADDAPALIISNDDDRHGIRALRKSAA
jgi:hypothetical protein